MGQESAVSQAVLAVDGTGARVFAARCASCDFGAFPILRTLPNGRRVLVAGQKSGMIWAMDPDRGGEVLWNERLGAGGALGGIQWGLAADETHVYVGAS